MQRRSPAPYLVLGLHSSLVDPCRPLRRHGLHLYRGHRLPTGAPAWGPPGPQAMSNFSTNYCDGRAVTACGFEGVCSLEHDSSQLVRAVSQRDPGNCTTPRGFVQATAAASASTIPD